ncbi:DUF3575 domain-containing protein [Zeaxanthinibacter enoshimensis]|nr:DUF3575 domain-containing protein [Zeaxanthinibacter enoshimensis]
MKKLLLPCLLLLFMGARGQAYPNPDLESEVKFNIGLFLATTTVEASYEYYLNDDVSLGGTLYLDDDPTDFNGNFGIGPNLRAYFGYQPRSGFFAEAFGLYFTGEDEIETTELGNRNNDYSSFAMGIGMGNKWTTRSERFALEVFGGFGRNLNPESYQSDFIYRAGLAIGVRF